MPAEVLFKTVDYLDRFLLQAPSNLITPQHLQSIGATALVIAMKACELDSKGLFGRVASFCDGGLTATDLKTLEWHILKTLSFDLNRPTALDFLYQYILPVHVTDENSTTKVGRMMKMAETILIRSLHSYDLSCCKPSLLAKIVLSKASQQMHFPVDAINLNHVHGAHKVQIVYYRRKLQSFLNEVRAA
ncbi:G2/mitotic-specific cyclin-B-like [Ptychodera flava]|uniref:G2/mitotic-specific cyclin-B-like n=1 Tax=Ptychodera flava TaxID=63121 RepID=UPI00396A72FD